MKFKRKWVIIIPPLLAAIAFSCGVYYDDQFYNNVVQIEYIGGQSSEMLLLRDERDYTIIDVSSGGSSYSQDAYSRSLKNCATEISSYVITHYHNYHQNSVRKILKKAIVRTLYLPYPQNKDEYYVMSGLITTAQSEGVDVVLYDSLKAINISDNVEFTLSDRHYLKRSTHPTFYFTINCEDQRFAYFSESVFDAEEKTQILTETMESSDYILLGGHGPKTKATETHVINLTDKSVIVSDKDVMSAFDIRLYGDSEMVESTLYCKVYINKNNK
jgi:beta-lactamase superfamily II metal-dependent hydrolase